MKKIIMSIFIATSLLTYSEENIIKQEVVGTNKQQLDIRELTTDELLLKNQNLESSSVEINGENFKNKDEKIKINQSDKITLEEELSQGIENKSYLKYILGGIGVVALIIAL